MKKQRSVACVSIIMIVIVILSVLVGSNQSPKSIVEEPANFVIASWDYPDEYGQGIELVAVYENSTGSWVGVGWVHEYDQDIDYEWNASVGIKFRVYTFFNSTLTGAIHADDGENYQRHNVIVTDNVGTTVFSQQNFTWYSVSTILDPLWYYGYEVVLNFLPLGVEIYTVVLTYEIFW